MEYISVIDRSDVRTMICGRRDLSVIVGEMFYVITSGKRRSWVCRWCREVYIQEGEALWPRSPVSS